MNLSNYTLEAMGFQALPPGETIVGAFHSCRVYEVRGFTLDADALDLHAGCIAGMRYSLSVGSSVNQICRKLSGDGYVDNEANWQKEHGCTPPYLVLLFGPTKEYEGNRHHFKIQDQTILTYDSFNEAKRELEAQEELILPSIISALACSFALADPEVRFVPTDRAVFGTTKDGRRIHDIRMIGSASLYGSRRFEAKEVQTRLADALRLAREIDVKEPLIKFPSTRHRNVR